MNSRTCRVRGACTLSLSELFAVLPPVSCWFSNWTEWFCFFSGSDILRRGVAWHLYSSFLLQSFQKHPSWCFFWRRFTSKQKTKRSCSAGSSSSPVRRVFPRYCISMKTRVYLPQKHVLLGMFYSIFTSIVQEICFTGLNSSDTCMKRFMYFIPSLFLSSLH